MSENTIIQAWVPRDFARLVRSHASASERSVSAEIRLALREHLRNDNAARTRGGVVSSLVEGGGEHDSG